MSDTYTQNQAKAATDAERARISAILALPGAMTTAAAAAQQCIAAGTPAADAAKVLATFRPAPAQSQKQGFADAMAATGNPDVRSLEPAEDTDPNSSSEIQGGWARAFGAATRAAKGGRP